MTRPRKTTAPLSEGELRIIGGRWRGRRLRFPAEPGLRPSPDRVRETLFNWLQGSLLEARCLDLFAGSGALGLEALSRGAAYCQFVDHAPAAIRRIQEHLQLLKCADGSVATTDVGRFLTVPPAAPFDIVFLDPPFRLDLLQPCLDALGQHGWLAPGAWVYTESGSDEALPVMPSGLALSRDKQAGQVSYRLWQAGA